MLNSASTHRQVSISPSIIVIVRPDLFSLRCLTEIREGRNLGTWSAEGSSGGTSGIGSKVALVGYLLGHRRCNCGVRWGWCGWFSLGPGWEGSRAPVPTGRSCGGNRATDSSVAWRRGSDNCLPRSILAIFARAAVVAFPSC